MKFQKFLIALATVVAGLCAAPSAAQVQWTSVIGATAVPTALTATTAVKAFDGSIVSAALAFDGEANALRISRISSTGATNWIRWRASYSQSARALFAHADNSVSLVYYDSTGKVCIENLSAVGDSRNKNCISDYSSPAVTVQLAPDDDIYIAQGSPRTVRKVSPLGIVRWASLSLSLGSYSGQVFASVDSAGNYVEFTGNRLVRWSAVDGTLLHNAVLAAAAQNYVASSPRANQQLVVSSLDIGANGISGVQVSRLQPDGSALWTTPVTFLQSYGRATLLAGDGDSVYVRFIPETYLNAPPSVVKLSASGAILWQRQFSALSQVLLVDSSILGVGYTTDAATSKRTASLYPISALDGSPGSAQKSYTANDAQVPSSWLPVTGGVVAAFDSSVSGYFTTTVASNLMYFALPMGSDWINSAMAPPARAMARSDCLMPRIAASGPKLYPGATASSPVAWWARSTVSESYSAQTWTKFDANNGAVLSEIGTTQTDCGAPFTSDGGRVVISASNTERVKKFSASGAVQWQYSSPNYVGYSNWNALTELPSGDIVYVTGDRIGRVTSAGVGVFETSAGIANVKYLTTDTNGNAWAFGTMPSTNTFVVIRVSPTGNLLSTTPLDAPGCYDSVSAATFTETDEMVVATETCGEGRVYKIGSSGQMLWQRLVTSLPQRPTFLIKTIHVEADGGVVAGGCAYGSQGESGDSGLSQMSAWTASGNERWTLASDLVGTSSECVTSINSAPNGTIYALASSSSQKRLPPVIWALASDGTELWRHASLLSSPIAAFTEARLDPSGDMIALGEAPRSELGPREVSLRRIQLSALVPSPLKLKFLSTPTTAVQYRSLFSVTVGLRTSADAPATAAIATVVRLALGNGTGNLDGVVTCTISVGESQCTASSIQYDAVEAGVTLTASSDGFAVATSPPLLFVAATTTTTLVVDTPGPYTAFSVVRVTARVDGPTPTSPLNYGLQGPQPASYSTTSNCLSNTAATALLSATCEMLMSASAMPITAQFSSSYSTQSYLSSSAPALTLPLTKAASTLLVTADPASNTFVAGDRVKLRVSILTATGLNVTGFVSPYSISLNAGSCSYGQQLGSFSTGWAGSYFDCQIPSAALGTNTVTASFAGNQDLLAAVPASISFSTVAGGVVRGYAHTVSVASICSTTPGVTCSAISDSSSNWQCVGPAGMSGDVYFVPPVGVTSYNYPGSPVQFSNVTGIVTTPNYVSWRLQVGACKPDVDGDGAVLTLTDGILVLRRMLGLQGAALVNNATHACVPKSALQIAEGVQLSGYDVDGDGQVLPETDGLLFLRFLLGFRGDSLVSNATNASATRRTSAEIQSFFSGSCGLY